MTDLKPTTSSSAAGGAKRTPKVGFVSLGCPKALVDSERIITHLRSEGYQIAPDYDGADVVVVNTCGFLDSAKQESLDAIGEAMAENGRVIVTGCFGVEESMIREAHPGVLAVTGPHQYEQVVSAVHDAVPPLHDPFVDLVPPEGLRLTPRHYAYLKISEGCNNRCSFCIIPALRGDLVEPPGQPRHGGSRAARESRRQGTAGHPPGHERLRPRHQVRREPMEGFAAQGHASSIYRGRWAISAPGCACTTSIPIPHVDDVIPLMAEGKILPYLDIPFQHASPAVLKAMRRPAHQEKTAERIRRWRDICPDLAIRSTFIVGFPGETEDDFDMLLQWLREAKIDRAGCFKYEAVAGAKANELPGAVPEEVKEERWNRFMAAQQEVSAELLGAKVGRTIDVIVDEIDSEGAIGRSKWDAPEIDGGVFIDGAFDLKPGDIVQARVTGADEYDLYAELT